MRIIAHALAVLAVVAAMNYVADSAIQSVSDLSLNVAAGKQALSDRQRRVGEWKVRCAASGGTVFRLGDGWETVCVHGRVTDTFDEDIWAFEEVKEGSP